MGPARILVPLVTRSEVLDFVTETAATAREELQREGLEFAADVPVGLMIETAAAAPMVAEWAPRAAFFALGTNDLTASALGLDRDDPAAAAQMDPLHPGSAAAAGRGGRRRRTRRAGRCRCAARWRPIRSGRRPWRRWAWTA